jgi:hypothetical protein
MVRAVALAKSHHQSGADVFRKLPLSSRITRLEEAPEHRDARVDAIRTEHVFDDALVDAQGPSQQRGLSRGVVAGQRQQASAQQTPTRTEGRPRVGPLLERGCQQTEDQVDGRATAGHVVLEVGVEPLVAQIDIGRQAHQQGILLEWIELE